MLDAPTRVIFRCCWNSFWLHRHGHRFRALCPVDAVMHLGVVVVIVVQGVYRQHSLDTGREGVVVLDVIIHDGDVQVLDDFHQVRLRDVLRFQPERRAQPPDHLRDQRHVNLPPRMRVQLSPDVDELVELVDGEDRRLFFRQLRKVLDDDSCEELNEHVSSQDLPHDVEGDSDQRASTSVVEKGVVGKVASLVWVSLHAVEHDTIPRFSCSLAKQEENSAVNGLIARKVRHSPIGILAHVNVVEEVHTNNGEDDERKKQYNSNIPKRWQRLYQCHK
mmetsp:Transcript_594/g.1544  ORF Transcript_594/g.1544 Transcript_594/m.1544 type:complete len:276 (-) Transcript_594:4789-5616(-)